MRLLEDRRIPGAEVDSSARYPPPKCHPSTREDLRSRITKWLMDNNRGRNILCLLGPAGIGKSAIAQTIAEQCKRTGRLGAAFFFSRPNHRDDPTRVIPTLAHQIAVQHTDYRRVITQRLADDSTILEKDMRTQFRELIIEPFKIISSCNPSILRRPLLITLDGLDECDGEEAQCEFIDLINEYVRLTKKSPLIWMVCSRPEWHLEAVLSDVDYVVEYHREVLKVNDAQSKKDVLRVLRDGFNDIQRQYRDVLDEPWPSETQLRQLAVASSGLFIFALTLLKFIADKTCGNPNAQLALILRLINNPWTPITPIATNPFHTLDFLYKQILSSIPADTLGTTKRILGLCVYYPDHNMSALALANFLGLDKGTFYAAIRRLHSVLDIPTASKAHSCSIQFHHASFREFLENPSRSGVFTITEEEVHRDFAIPCIQWCNYDITSNCQLNDRCRTEAPGLTWILQDRHEELYKEIGKFSKQACWEMCRRMSKRGVPVSNFSISHPGMRTLFSLSTGSAPSTLPPSEASQNHHPTTPYSHATALYSVGGAHPLALSAPSQHTFCLAQQSSPIQAFLITQLFKTLI
ncbi:hypothetical protein P691DRAFT_408481 [Macrolepiota fuliginosa MF-IS2]|uniref:Nephrocystin 3-like N-terminal domain-containing protein n=1 Tax=Macrolepiota fuliginosa MF-IS2 TaxID=1400762 RepID=A0A9P5X2N9_9AGAR|nr:hypothetical protein P691DRAFT_408481 [Macrolepiota fuliginosa MF-IS2]